VTEVCDPFVQTASNATARFYRPARNEIGFRPMSHPLLRRALQPCGLDRSLAPTPGLHLARGETTEAWLFERGTARITVEASDATSRRFFPIGLEVAEVDTRVSWKLVFRRLG
jgi:hypothetical protein